MRENRIIIYILINFNKYDYFAKINKLIFLSYSGGQKENKMACFFAHSCVVLSSQQIIRMNICGGAFCGRIKRQLKLK